MRKCWLAVIVIYLTGCGTTSSYQREHDVEANLPRAQGLGAFAPACLFFCFPTVTFSHGDDTIDPNATEALMHSKLNIEASKQGNAIIKAPANAMVTSQKGKPKKPPPPKGNTP